MQEINTNVELIKLLINLINRSHQLLHITDVPQVSPKVVSGEDDLRAPTASTMVRQTGIHRNWDFALAKSQFMVNLMLKEGLTHYKE